MRLVYWVAVNLFDSRKTFRTLSKSLMIGKLNFGANIIKAEFAEPKKVVLTFNNPFQLLNKCLSGKVADWERED